MNNKSFAALIFASIFLAAAASGQTAKIAGVVRGPDGKPMKNADVRLESKAKGVAAQTVKTNTSGRYEFSALGVGKYRVTVLSGSQVQGYMDNINTSTTKAAKVDFDIRGGAAGQPKKTKHLVWVPSETGTNLGGRWVEEDNSTGNERVDKQSGESLRRIQNNAGSVNSNSPGGGR
jgi:uncharacterized surface anchored protein